MSGQLSWNVLGDFLHDEPGCIGDRAWDAFDKALDDLKKDTLRKRKLAVAENGRCKLPVIVSNIGAWTAMDYHLQIRFNKSSVRIVSHTSESLKTAVLFHHDARFDASRPKSARKTRTIRKAYDEYLRPKRPSDYLFLYGNLESQTYEMVVLDLFIEDRKLEDFGVIFRITSPMPYPHRAILLQNITIVRDKTKNSDS